ncbi:MAG: hypothetical protein IKC49_00195 [Clostridia bacterium]|nr:hypothetical protein [Clostridia bacterium]
MKGNAFLVKLNSKENLEYLSSIGYDNVQNITFDNLRVKVIAVDTAKEFFLPISVTCLAGIQIKPLDFEEFRQSVLADYSSSNDLER